MASIDTMLGLIGKLESPYITVHQERCALVRNRHADCLRCAESCASGCISYDGEVLTVSPEKCIGCGTCATVCPTCALEAHHPSDAALTAAARASLAANEGAAYLRIDAEDPETLLGVSPARLVAAQRTSSAERETFDRLQMANGFPWCVAGAPIAAWARKVFPDRSEGDAVAALWDAILKTVRVTGDGNAEARWREHIALLTARKEKLNALRFKSLHYTNSLGTDLTIELPDDHLWAAGNSETPAGVGFVANLPTEEIFTAPLKMGANGTVCAALPLVNNGSIIEDIRFTVREGRIVEAKASRGEDVLNAAIAVDDGARYFGEVALVPYDSPIRSSGLLFYNTLYDENASCHLAFGEAYPECIAGGERMTREELDAHGLNHSLTHVDFMVGTADLSITGTTHDGRELPVFRSGNFAL